MAVKGECYDKRRAVGPILDALKTAVEAGGTLPAAAYCDPDFFRYEQDALLRRTWMLAGAGGQVPNQGDAVPVEIAGRSLILLRDKGAIRVLSNVCPHRGALILSRARSALPMLTCPYHGWSFSLSGDVKTMPHFHGEGIHGTGKDCSARIQEIRSGVWNDLVFVNIDGNAPDLESYMMPVDAHFDGFDFTSMRYGGTFDLDAPGNWKLVAENYLDNYHIFAVHPSIDASFPQDRRKPARLIDPPLILGGYDMDSARPSYLGSLPVNPNVSEGLKRRNSFFTVFPNVLLHVWPYCVMAMQLVPAAPDRTIERYFFYFYGAEETLGGDDGSRDAAMAAYRDVNELQDFPLVSAMQASRASGAFDQGRLSPYWDCMVHDYAKLYAEALQTAAMR